MRQGLPSLIQKSDYRINHGSNANTLSNSKIRAKEEQKAVWESANSLYLPEIGMTRNNGAKYQYKKAFSTDSARLGSSAANLNSDEAPKMSTWNVTKGKPNPSFLGLNKSYGLKRNESKSAGMIGIGLRKQNAFVIPNAAFKGNISRQDDKDDNMFTKQETNMKVRHKPLTIPGQISHQSFNKDTPKNKSELMNQKYTQPMMPQLTMSKQEDGSGPFYKLPRSPLLSDKSRGIVKHPKSSMRLQAGLQSSPESATKYLNRLQPINQQIQAIQRDIDELDNRFQYYEARIGRK